MSRNAKIVTWSLVGVLVAGLMLAGGAFLVFRSQTRCTVYVAGSDAQVTVTGFGARSGCKSLIDGGRVTTLKPDGPTGARVVCVIPVGRDSYTVRDTGLNLVGAELCDTFETWATPGD